MVKKLIFYIIEQVFLSLFSLNRKKPETSTYEDCEDNPE